MNDHARQQNDRQTGLSDACLFDALAEGIAGTRRLLSHLEQSLTGLVKSADLSSAGPSKSGGTETADTAPFACLQAIDRASQRLSDLEMIARCAAESGPARSVGASKRLQSLPRLSEIRDLLRSNRSEPLPASIEPYASQPDPLF